MEVFGSQTVRVDYHFSEWIRLTAGWHATSAPSAEDLYTVSLPTNMLMTIHDTTHVHNCWFVARSQITRGPSFSSL